MTLLSQWIVFRRKAMASSQLHTNAILCQEVWLNKLCRISGVNFKVIG